MHRTMFLTIGNINQTLTMSVHTGPGNPTLTYIILPICAETNSLSTITCVSMTRRTTTLHGNKLRCLIITMLPSPTVSTRRETTTQTTVPNVVATVMSSSVLNPVITLHNKEF